MAVGQALLDENCLTRMFRLLHIGGIQSQEWIIKHECQLQVRIIGQRWQKCRLPHTNSWSSRHTTKQAKDFLFFYVCPSALPPFCLYNSPLCSSSSLSLSLCVDVSMISTLLFGASPVVIVLALTVPVPIME